MQRSIRKKADPDNRIRAAGGNNFSYFEGGGLPPPAETGGQGLRVADVPGVVESPEFGEPGFDEPELDDPPFEPLVAPGVPGKVPHGEPLGLVPGLLGLFGFTVGGCVLPPGVGGFGEFEPGTVEGVFGVVVPVGGFVGAVDGVVAPVGGVVVPGVWACPEAP